jgi:xanthosine utilization system XapX-like protein
MQTPAQDDVAQEQPPQERAVQHPPAAGIPTPHVMLWLGVAVLVGVGLRFMKLPEAALPVLVGVGVAGLIGYLLRNQITPAEPVAAPVPDRTPRNGQTGHGRTLASRLEEVRQHNRQSSAGRPAHQPNLPPSEVIEN